MRVDYGAAIQLFVPDGCPRCVCKIEGAMARGVNSQFFLVRLRSLLLKLILITIGLYFAIGNYNFWLSSETTYVLLVGDK